MSKGLTATEKILSRVLGRQTKRGEIIFPEPELIVIHDWYAANVGRMLDELGVNVLHAPERVMFVTDHEPVAVSEDAARRQAEVRNVASRFRIGMFFDAGRGGHGHVFPVEMGYVRPGMFIEAYDTHVPNYGAVGALGIPLLTEITEVLALGSAWIRVPDTVRVQLSGNLSFGVSIRDVAQYLIADLDPEVIDYTVVEFGGSALSDLSIDSRYTLCNTPVEIGAKSAMVEPDALVDKYLATRVHGESYAVTSDPDAKFKCVVNYDLDTIVPQIAVPPRPDNVTPITDYQGTVIHHAFVGSCASGLLSDMEAAASVLKGRHVHPRVRLFITPATQEIYREAARRGLLEVFAEAGAMVTAPGCGPCAGGRIGPLATGETSINTGTRNDPGRLGPSEGQIYLASPASVAAAAVAGEIVDPRELLLDGNDG